ncbi:MAG: hypothetical protein ACI311_01855 [Bacilli bacterium]
MITLFKFLWVEINFSSFMAFLWGVLFGAILIVAIYVINVLASLRKSRYIMENRIKTIDKNEIDILIKDAQNDFLVKRKEKDPEKNYLVKIIMGLVTDIAKLYHPKSKKPLAELTFDELILLSHYITDTIDGVLSRPAIKIFKRMKLSTVLNLMDMRKAKVVKAAEKMKVGKVAKYASMAFNCINPFYWFKKAVFDTSFALITKKITLVAIAVVGEQTNRVFSKEALYEESGEIDELLKEIDNDIEEIKKEDGEKPEEDLTPKSKEIKKVVAEEQKELSKQKEQPSEKKSFFERFKKNKKEKEKVK